MIRIFKDKDIRVVTQGVYKNLYEPLGYKPVIEEKKSKVVVQKVEETKPEEPELENVKENKRIKESSKSKRRRGE